jgi:hypothetical protein
LLVFLLALSLRPDSNKVKNSEQDNQKTQLKKLTACGLATLRLCVST